ncbi:hypothetical protein K7X08_024140 [Anisodus acutangulus]|uniref:Exonuclease 1 n=1 Tax=Anisodus acutangulus TaxID=402998 RepID=A0A9Q1REX5_9SOLA|nr:hypothetical protein K7X08_024140 [Anisodus acutangulus]
MVLCLNSEGDKKLQFLNYFMHRINMLRHYKITPVVVFDGGNLPCKGATEVERHNCKEKNRDQPMLKLKEGNIAGAIELFQRTVSVTPSMAHQLIQILKSENIEFVVAPYEADAQLAYLSNLEEEKNGIVAVISEDSDLLAYGCPAVFFKMDAHGQEVVLDNVFSCVTRVPSFRHFNKDLFTGMCVLAGCDFLPSVHGIGRIAGCDFLPFTRAILPLLATAIAQETSTQASKYSSIFAISSSKSKKETTVVEMKQAPDEWKRSLFMEERECLEEAVALQSMLCPSISTRKMVGEEKKSQQKEVLKVPDNNPFSKRKVEEVEPDVMDSVTELVSEVTEVESLEVLVHSRITKKCGI